MKIKVFLGELGPPNPPKMAQFMAAPSPLKLLKIYNLRTTNAMKMKLGTIVYLREFFHLTKDLGVAPRGFEGVV